jgi:hypothetical protein
MGVMQRDFPEERIPDSLFNSIGRKSKQTYVVDVTGCRTTWMHTDFKRARWQRRESLRCALCDCLLRIKGEVHSMPEKNTMVVS